MQTRQLVRTTDRPRTVRFDVEKADSQNSNIIEKYGKSKSDGGSASILHRCLTDIAYGLKYGHKDIDAALDEKSVMERLVDMTTKCVNLV